MAETPETPDPRDLILKFLHEQFTHLSPSGDDNAALLTLRTSDGRYVGDVRFSEQDVQTLSMALESILNYRDCTEENSRPDVAMPPLPVDDEPLPTADAKDVKDLLAGIESLVNGEQQ